MADLLGLISNALAPFLENPTIVYLIVWVDMWGAFELNQHIGVAGSDSPLIPLNADFQEYYSVSNSVGANGERQCIATDPLGLFFITGVFYHRASIDEINQFCHEIYNPCLLSNIQSVTQGIGCSFSDGSVTRNQNGAFGDMLTLGVQSIAQLSDIEFLKTIQIQTWEIFIAMLMIPLFLWAVTTSGRS